MRAFRIPQCLPLCCLLLFWTVKAHSGIQLTNLISFTGGNGASAEAALMQATDGNFYGVTVAGGISNLGTIYRMSLQGTLTTLISFQGTNGAYPKAELIEGVDGNFYGTTFEGGASGLGTVYKITSNNNITTLFSFNGTNGANPESPLVQDDVGNFFGTTYGGGQYGLGTVFKINTNHELITLVSFSGPDGSRPRAGLTRSQNGDLFGTTEQGGIGLGFGTIFKVTSTDIFIPFYLFSSYNGSSPNSELVPNRAGNFYGSTFYGGTHGAGTIFEFSTNGSLATIFSFNGTNGAYPKARPIEGPDGSILGTTQGGGPYAQNFALGAGTIFQITSNGLLATSIPFTFGGNNGYWPFAGLIKGNDGRLYGTTAYGSVNAGAVFRLSLPFPPELKPAININGDFNLQWDAVIGQFYQLQYNSSLSSTTWSNWGSAVFATNTMMTASDVITLGSQKFYRAMVLP